MNRCGYSIVISLTLIFTGCSSNNPLTKFAQTKESQDAAINALFTQDDPSSSSVKDSSSKKNGNKASGSSVEDTSSTTEPVAKPKANKGIRLPDVKPIDVEGNMVIAGSSTVYPLTKTMYDRFIQEGYPGTIKLDSVGTGAGFKLFCKEGETDISNASRPIKEEEVKDCNAKNRKPISFRVGTDALAIVVNPANDFLTNVTLKELSAIFTAEKWSDVNPKWPKVPIQRFIPDTDSGTFEFFVEKVLDKKKAPILNASNTQASSDDEELVQGVSANQYAIGFFGYAYYHENAKVLKVLSLEGVEPNFTTVEEGKYPLARPLILYSDANIIKNKHQVAAFINFYLTHVNEEIGRVGYFPASQKVLDEAKVNLLKALGYEDLLKQQSP